MPRGQRQSRNPVEKLQSHVAQLENIVQSILEAADKPDFVASVVALRKAQEEAQAKKSKMNNDSREVVKLLQTYPGLSKQVLVSLKSKITEYKSLDVLDKYKTDPEPQEKKKPEPKQKASSPVPASAAKEE